ncbi:MAG: hypothetical protein ACPHEP_10945 [Acidimicrobiales bacterium]
MKLDLEIPEEEETITYEPLPAGWYSAKITSAEDVTTQAGDAAVKISFLVENGRTVNSWYNLGHSTERVREIAEDQVKAMGRAVGLARVADTSDVEGHSLEIRLVPDGEFNAVKGYRRLVSSAPSSSGNATPKGTAPWAQ